MLVITPPWYSYEPCEKFMRTMLRPHSRSMEIFSGAFVFGPIVQMMPVAQLVGQIFEALPAEPDGPFVMQVQRLSPVPLQAEQLALLHRLETQPRHPLQLSDIVARIIDNRTRYEARNAKREKKELKYVQEKAFVEELSGTTIPGKQTSGNTIIQHVANLTPTFAFIKSTTKIVGIGPQDVADGNPGLVLGLLWSLIVFFASRDLGANQTKDLKKTLLDWVQKRWVLGK